MPAILCPLSPLSMTCVRELLRIINHGLLKEEVKDHETYAKNLEPRRLSRKECEVICFAELGLHFLSEDDPKLRTLLEKSFVTLLKEKKSTLLTFLALWVLTNGGIEVSEETREAIADFKANHSLTHHYLNTLSL